MQLYNKQQNLAHSLYVFVQTFKFFFFYFNLDFIYVTWNYLKQQIILKYKIVEKLYNNKVKSTEGLKRLI